MALASSRQIADQDVRTASSVAGTAKLGEAMTTADGRTFVYGLNGAGALSAGKLTAGLAPSANHINRTGVTAAIGATQLTFAVGATAVTANQYAGGYLQVNAGTGAGQNLLIASNTLAASSGSPTINLREPLYAATAVADSKFSLIPNVYAGVVVVPFATATAAIPTGIPAIAVTAAYYAWFQTGGLAAALIDGTPAVGSGVIPSDAVAGALEVEAAATVTARVAIMAGTGVDTEYKPVLLSIKN